MRLIIKQFIGPIFVILIGLSTTITAQERIIEINSVRNSDNSIDIFYVKNKPGSYTVKLKFKNVTNSNVSDYEDVVQFDSGKLLTINPIDKQKSIAYSSSISYIFGDLKPKVDSLFQYILPFKKGKSKTVFESDNANEKYFGAEKPEDWKSYFTGSKTADTIYAMRKGIVVDIKNEFVTDTLMKFTSKKNSILIEHADGTIASYKGFKLNSILVKLGETVYPATQLGILDMNKGNSYFLTFSVFYLGKDTFDENIKSTLKTAKSSHIYLSPYFFTKEGVVKIIPNTKYTVDYNEGILTKEFTRKELKNRKLKN